MLRSSGRKDVGDGELEIYGNLRLEDEVGIMSGISLMRGLESMKTGRKLWRMVENDCVVERKGVEKHLPGEQYWHLEEIEEG